MQAIERIIPVIILGIVLIIVSGCDIHSTQEEHGFFHDTAFEFPQVDESTYTVPPPPFTGDYFPCSQCHADLETNKQRRELVDMHDDIIFNHDSENRWCLDCHDADARDSLRLASGKHVDFKESYKLCGQCHGPKYRDWKLGIHGKRTGFWNGKKEYLLCVHCHDPHSPRFKKLQPMPPPKRPKQLEEDTVLVDTTQH